MNIAERVGKAETPTMLVVRCLGRFRLEDGSGNQLQVRTRKARALLATLAVSGRPMSRDALADVLWSDRGPVQARSSLRQAIFELQHFATDDSSILVVGRDDLAVRHDQLITDIDLIRSAAGDADWPRLLALLEGCEPGLLTDLDGLDQEFDDWLRLERAQEPARTVAATVDAAERCRSEAGPRAALDLVSEILRLDPVNEEATRLALRIDHDLGDNRALHHHYRMLSGRLRDDYGAEPSTETAELFRQLSGGSVARLPGNSAQPCGAAPQGVRSGWLRVIVPTLILALAAALLALLYMRESEAPSAANGPILIAVLPFDQQPAGDRFLAEGLWDDTRTALSLNPSLQVLGRTTARAMADANSSTQTYAERLGVDYLLEGSVRRSANQVRVTVSLIRTSDGVAIWNSVFRGRLGDPMTLQEAIAREIEGRLRGRLARGGGRRAEQIATTPEVYALYSEARTLIRQRDSDAARRADRLLRRAVVLDPNFAPAWASLASAAHFSTASPVRHAVPREQALGYLRKAIELAPNLAEAHATMALIAGPSARQSEPALERALALDPGNAEAWNWLGNVRMSQFRVVDAVPAYSRAVEIDPLFTSAAHNLVQVLADTGDLRGAQQSLTRLERAGADRVLLVTARGLTLISTGDYSAAAGQLLDLTNERTSPGLAYDNFGLGEVLFRLGYFDEAAKAWHLPAWLGSVLRGQRVPPDDLIEDDPTAFWQNDFHAAYAGRAMVNLGQKDRFVSLYRATFRTPEDFVEAATEIGILEVTAPTLSVALRDLGDSAAADAIVVATVERLERLRRHAPGHRGLLWQLGMVRAVQGQEDEALRLLAQAAHRGWRPDGLLSPLDIAQEPGFRGLRDDPRFETIRRRFLDHIAKERAELGPLKI